jgi:hypothetical protein
MVDHESGKIYVDDYFNCLDYNFRKRILIAGTAKGKVYMWKCNLTQSIIPISTESWEPYCIVDSILEICNLKWSNYMGLVHVTNRQGQHAMLSETILQKKMNKKIMVVQISHKTIELIDKDSYEKGEKCKYKKIETSESIKGLDLFNNTLLTWNGSMAFIFDINLGNMTISKVHSFPGKSNLLCLNE